MLQRNCEKTGSVAWELSFLVFHELRCIHVALSLVCAAQFNFTYSTQYDNIAWKLRLPVSLVCPGPTAEEENKNENWYVILGAGVPEKSSLGKEGRGRKGGRGQEMASPYLHPVWLCCSHNY
jgi:hypothetical protein